MGALFSFSFVENENSFQEELYPNSARILEFFFGILKFMCVEF